MARLAFHTQTAGSWSPECKPPVTPKHSWKTRDLIWGKYTIVKPSWCEDIFETSYIKAHSRLTMPHCKKYRSLYGSMVVQYLPCVGVSQETMACHMGSWLFTVTKLKYAWHAHSLKGVVNDMKLKELLFCGTQCQYVNKDKVHPSYWQKWQLLIF